MHHFVASPREREKREETVEEMKERDGGERGKLIKVKILFELRFHGPVNPMGSCRAQSVYLTTRLLGRLSPLSG